MLKVKLIRLGKQVYRCLMKRVLERDSWQCRQCGPRSWRTKTGLPEGEQAG